MAVTSVNLTPRVGAEIKVDAETLLSGAARKEIRAVLEQRGVIVVRGVDLEDAQLLAVGKTLGTIRLGTALKETDTGIFKVTFDKSQGAFAEYLKGTFVWHMDGHHEDVPPLASMLTPRVLAPAGGQTEFANTYAAYDDLPESEKKYFETLRIVHTLEAVQRAAIPNATAEQVQNWRKYPSSTHPLIWHHRSGRKSLVLGSSVTRVVDMDEKESNALLRRLMEWTTQRQYVYQHQWKMGDMLMWDNTGTMHRVLPFDIECGRRLHRVTLEGEESVAAAA